MRHTKLVGRLGILRQYDSIPIYDTSTQPNGQHVIRFFVSDTEDWGGREVGEGRYFVNLLRAA